MFSPTLSISLSHSTTSNGNLTLQEALKQKQHLQRTSKSSVQQTVQEQLKEPLLSDFDDQSKETGHSPSNQKRILCCQCALL